jgi:cellulose synthase (UDP-forming)
MVVSQIPGMAPPGRHDLAVNLGWSGYALVVLFLGLLVAVELPRRRRHERMAIRERAWLDGVAVDLLDLSTGGACVAGASLTGASLTRASLTRDGAAGQVRLHVAEVGNVVARVVRRQPGRLYLEFATNPAAHDRLIRKLYTGPAVLPAAQYDPGRAAAGVLRRGFVSKV